MKGWAWFGVYAALAFVLGGALAGPFYAALSAFGLEPMAFPKFTLRLVQFFALLGLWPLLHALGLHGARAFGLASEPGGRGFLFRSLAGFVAGTLMVAAVLVALLALGARSGAVLAPDIDWPAYLASVLATAVLVAFVEELWFRGALHSAFERIGGVHGAVFAVAALYCAVHFIDPGPARTPEDLGAGSGFAVLGGAFHEFSGAGIAGPAAALFAAGLLLGVVRHRRGGIAECIGIHAGWILAIKIGRTLTVPEPDSPWHWLSSGYDGVVGWAACALFALAALICWYRLPPSRPAG